MSHSAAKTTQRAAADRKSDSTSGRNAKAVAPPAYGIDFVDGGMPEQLKAGIGALSGMDLSDVRVHANSAKPAQIDALAYTRGNDIHLGPGQEKHLPHEAWHVVQQRQGRVAPTLQSKGVAINDDAGLEKEADAMGEQAARAVGRYPGPASLQRQPRPVVQRRRVPRVDGGSGLGNLLTSHRVVDPLDLLTGTVEEDAANFDAHSEGLQLVIKRASAALTPDQRAAARTQALGLLSEDQFRALAPRQQLLRIAAAVQAILPALQLGDPGLIDTGPRGATTDAANITTLVTNANTVLDAIAAGTYDAGIGQIFGVANVAAAKAKYALARTWLNNIHGNNRIVTDRSGYSAEAGIAGLTSFQTQISLAPGIIDSPNDNESVVTLIHESTHAGNNEVKDYGYITQASFTTLPVATKLTNAAHFEVVPRRRLGAAHAFAGQTFVPAGAVGLLGVVAPVDTPTQVAIRTVSEKLRSAWTIALNLHKQLVDVHKTPTLWNTDWGGGKTYAGAMPYWSKVEKLTIHRKADIDRTSVNPARQPVSLIDIALSEGVIKKLHHAMNNVPTTELLARAFENANATAEERIVGMIDEAAFLLGLVLKVHVQDLTGSVARDVRVVNRLAQVGLATYFNDMYAAKDPATFAD